VGDFSSYGEKNKKKRIPFIAVERQLHLFTKRFATRFNLVPFPSSLCVCVFHGFLCTNSVRDII
jgi:hypothetical protein